jgi:hypothetical protein
MLPQYRRREARHFASHDVEARGFEPAKHRSNEALFHAIGLKDNEGFLHMNRPK